jgi:hypothetical protein
MVGEILRKEPLITFGGLISTESNAYLKMIVRRWSGNR